MKAPWTPMRWPSAWTGPAALDLLRNSSIDTLLIDNGDELEPVRAMAERQGLRVVHPDTPPDGVKVIKGVWPGVKRSRRAGDATAGPTGVPWVDANGWAVRLAAAMDPDCAVWVDAAPDKQDFRRAPGAWLAAVADSAAFGGRWIVTLDDALAEGIAARQESAMAAWKTITQATSFFAAHQPWNEYSPAGNLGVISSFSGEDEFFSHELLNLLERAGVHFLVLPRNAAEPTSFERLRAVVYADAAPPPAELRRQVLEFVRGGGTLITGPGWGPAAGLPEHPRFLVSSAGKGRIAQSTSAPDDPYQMANDCAVLVSHRYDLVRFWNAGATASDYAVAADRKQAVAHLLFYADRGPDSASVRIAGPYRHVRASLVTGAVPVEVVPGKDALEIHLPQVSQYVALELSL